MVDHECDGGQIYQQFQCYTIDPDVGGRGVTYWGFPNGYHVYIGSGSTATFCFTCTGPTCYSDKDACIAYFNAYIDAIVNPTPASVELKYHLNTVNNIGGCFLSGVYHHGGRQGFDFAFATLDAYNAGVRNTFRIENPNDFAVFVEDFKILRVYQMCNLDMEKNFECTSGHECPPMPNYSPTGNLDPDNPPYVGRRDFPCNCDGGTISFTHYNNTDYANITIPSGGTVKFTIDWTDHSTLNYVGGSVCFFNFNQIITCGTSSYDDVTLSAYISTIPTPFATYHLNAIPNDRDSGIFPSYDLMQVAGYNDSGANTIKLVNNSDVPVKMFDSGGVNVYRTYETESISCYCTCEGCQIGCEVLCQVGCEVSCQTACEISCQTACQVSCQTGCQVTCQTGCEVACQTGCEVACQTACEVACQDCQQPCQISCQPGCQTSCQICYLCITCYSCFVMCQETCQISCQTGCEVACQTACELACQDCQTGCQVTCQTGCEVSCQTACEVSCQGCEGCQICVTCQTSETCPIVYYTCQQCETCQPAYA